MPLSLDIIKQYNKSRSCSDKALICHAPSVNLNFDQYGAVRACCYNTKDVLGTWPQKTVSEIWHGLQRQELMAHIRANDLGGGCHECGSMIASGHHHGVRAAYFDEFAISPLQRAFGELSGRELSYPRVMEFEISNECNLECIMCNGSFSSAIRKNREKLPPLISPYDDTFVDQLDEFIPHLTDAKFLGGEPFMIEIYLKIWERIRALNPSVRIHITTNGSMLNARIKTLLESLHAGIVLSIDSLDPDTYSMIRQGGRLDRIMAHIPWFRDYTLRKKTFFSFAVCPMLTNWREIPAILAYCQEHNIDMHLNAVFTPLELSLRELPADRLQEIISYYLSLDITAGSPTSRTPRHRAARAFLDYIRLLQGWHQEKLLPSPTV